MMQIPASQEVVQLDYEALFSRSSSSCLQVLRYFVTRREFKFGLYSFLIKHLMDVVVTSIKSSGAGYPKQARSVTNYPAFRRIGVLTLSKYTGI